MNDLALAKEKERNFDEWRESKGLQVRRAAPPLAPHPACLPSCLCSSAVEAGLSGAELRRRRHVAGSAAGRREKRAVCATGRAALRHAAASTAAPCQHYLCIPLGAARPQLPIDMNVTVLTTGFWPSYKVGG